MDFSKIRHILIAPIFVHRIAFMNIHLHCFYNPPLFSHRPKKKIKRIINLKVKTIFLFKFSVKKSLNTSNFYFYW